MGRIATFVVASCLALSGCARDGALPEGAPTPSPSFRPGTAIIETDHGAVLVNVEVADSQELQQLGLMHRESLAEDAGMIFLFFEDHTSGFWMKNTQIPLSIAFFDRGGKILKILDMEPCERDPCPTYEPNVSYRGALEVNEGAFKEWGVELGDVIRVSP
ncbi:MAG: uncharacterized protein QOG16_1547 [Actinomycetota bacterium]|jgi:uncharacterized membrane protein (UPF0127 family)|nr:uncharacterized protein [Actinomycetota bacterium]